MKAINLGRVFEQYKGMWVTLTESLDTVISADKNPQTALDAALKKGYNSVLMRQPTFPFRNNRLNDHQSSIVRYGCRNDFWTGAW
jgi:hypothetical protein